MNSVRSNNLKLHLIFSTADFVLLMSKAHTCTMYNVHTMYCTADVLELCMHRRYNEVLMNGLWHCTVWKRQIIALQRDGLETVLYYTNWRLDCIVQMYQQCLVNKQAGYNCNALWRQLIILYSDGLETVLHSIYINVLLIHGLVTLMYCSVKPT